MDPDALRTFLAIQRSGGFTRAARRLHLSQPAISRRIAMLEHEAGAPLFERIAGGVVLSEAGRVLLPRAERALAALEDCAEAMRSLKGGAAGAISLALVGTLANEELAAVLAKFSRRHPGVALTLRTATSVEVSDLVRRGEATLGVRYLRDASPEIACEALPPERLVVCCAPEHRLAGGRVRSLSELADETWLAFPNPRDDREATAGNLLAAFLARGVGSLRWMPVDSLTAQKRLLEAGFGLALLPRNSILEEAARGSLATISTLDYRAENPVFAITRRGGYASPAARDLLALLAARPARAAGRIARRARVRR